jgi:hypothetical protein
MSMRPLDLRGQRFGQLTATKFLGLGPQGGIWECSCECGGTTIKPTKELTRRGGFTKGGYPMNCGCNSGARLRIMAAQEALEAQLKKDKPDNG